MSLLLSCISEEKPNLPDHPVNNLPYPRLSMWWPDSWDQNITELSRYDYIGWGDWEKEETVSELKILNPKQLHFMSINITETDWDEWEDIPIMSEIPAKWFLTQSGSNLVADINSTQSKIGVIRTRDIYNNPLFEAGDTLACGFESMRLISVNYNNNILSVKRGFVRTAEPHLAGVRIAAHIEFWPQTWVMNLSTLCPQFDAGAGNENWTDWALRKYLPYKWSLQRDGYLIDRIEDEESWLVEDGIWGRNIDPDCSNISVSDNYQDFNAAWKEGIQGFLPKIRKILNGKPLFGNTFGSYFPFLNGSIWESCPGNWSDTETETYSDWKERVLGFNGYIEVSQKGYFPNFSTVETYELEEYLPDPEENNPMLDPDFEPDYKRMRFGITTALLGNGYFSYEINTNGHGSLGLMWFDEYDNAGEGRGYLGFPVNDARSIIDLGSEGKVFRRDFNNGIVICNPTNVEVKVDLGKIYKLINGTQDPEINSGKQISEVVIGPRDGRILLK